MDQRALDILLRTYWTTAGWRPESERIVSDADFAHAEAAGLMFAPASSSHDEFVRRLADEIARCEKTQVANAFLASLSTRRLDWRSALGSYAVFHRMGIHSSPRDSRSCEHCGMSLTPASVDLNLLNFERFKWGGVRHSQVEYALLDLVLFNRGPFPQPTPRDIEIFRELIATCRTVGPELTSARLHKHLPRSLKGNKAEKDVLVEILGLAGVLGTADHPGFAKAFVPASARELPGRRFVDMGYPACWWSSKSGVDEASLAYFFGHIEGA